LVVTALITVVSSLINHRMARDVNHFQPNAQRKLKVLHPMNQLLQFRRRGAAARHNVIGHHVVGEVEQSRIVESTPSELLPLQCVNQGPELLPIGSDGMNLRTPGAHL
jgi:hypothetical protein